MQISVQGMRGSIQLHVALNPKTGVTDSIDSILLREASKTQPIVALGKIVNDNGKRKV